MDMNYLRRRGVMSSAHTESLSDDIVSFYSDYCAKVKDLTIGIEPVQDLHGYDAPWPSGGGKNLLNPSYFSARDAYTVNADGSITVNSSDGTGWSSIEAYQLKAGTYTLSRSNTTGICDVRLSTEDYGTSHIMNAGANYVTFTLASDGAIKAKIGYSASSYPFTTTLQLESGSSKTDYAPYSNICPITGHTGGEVYDDPKYGGLVDWNQYLKYRTFTSNGIIAEHSGNYTELYVHGENTSGSTIWPRLTDVAFVKSSHVYVTSISVNGTLGGTQALSVKNLLGNTDVQMPITNGHGYQLTKASADNNSVYIFKTMDANETINAKFKMGFFDLTQMFGSTVADSIYAMEQATTGAGIAYFHSLFGKDYYVYNTGTITNVSSVDGGSYRYIPISWTSAGTVYGGTVDVTSGVLRVDRVIDTITKDSAWYGFSTGTGNSSAVVQLTEYQNCYYVDGTSTRNGAISSTGKEAENYWVSARQNEVPNDGDMCFAYSSSGQLRFHRTDVSSITTLDAFKAVFPNTQIAYKLATPITYQLTPQELKTLLGQNNIWSTTGDVEVTYWMWKPIKAEEGD